MIIEQETSDGHNLICPYCGGRHSDSYEYFTFKDDAVVECGHCERDFSASRVVDVTYEARPIGVRG